MIYQDVCTQVEKIKKKYGELSPKSLCKKMGILLIPRSFGTQPGCIKGFFTVKSRIKAIVYNCDLPETIQNIIIFHEIGHSVLHAGNRTAYFSDVTMYETNSMAENEANLFAAECMLDDEEVMGTINEGCTFFTSAALLGVPPEFFDFKFRIMKWKGYRLCEPVLNTKSVFLKDLEIYNEQMILL